jgi:GTP-binding protein
MDIRNIAIIAHVDHGKTTLVDAMLRAGGIFAAHQNVVERVMDSNAQERERGITIYAKNASINYKGTKINIVDTPGHADFGSEVERVLRTVDAVLLLVDAYEGPMPQTKFVLGKSLSLDLPVLVVINKIDKSSARPEVVLDLTFDLFVRLGASDAQLDFPYIYTNARDAYAIRELTDQPVNITPLLDFILENVKPAVSDQEQPFRMQPAALSYDNYIGRLAVGRVFSGQAKSAQEVYITGADGKQRTAKLGKIFTFQGMQRVESEQIVAGDIVAISGIPDLYVGETVCGVSDLPPLPAIQVDPPALAMDFVVNNSPFAGREGDYITSRHIRARLLREIESNVGLKVEMTENADTFKVYGRGEMHLAVLIESMRREGFELQVSQPQVVLKEVDGLRCEPFELGVVTVPDEMSGKIISALAVRKAELKSLHSANGNTVLEFIVPTRGLLGFRSQFILLTHGEGTMYHSFDHYGPWCGKIEKREVGSLISGYTGAAVSYALFNLQERGPLFISPGTEVYDGMIIGEHNQGIDLVVNPLKEKKLTNVRSSSSDESIRLNIPLEIGLEKAIEYIKEDELVEVTPKNIRLRKRILDARERKRELRRDQD